MQLGAGCTEVVCIIGFCIIVRQLCGEERLRAGLQNSVVGSVRWCATNPEPDCSQLLLK